MWTWTKFGATDAKEVLSLLRTERCMRDSLGVQVHVGTVGRFCLAALCHNEDEWSRRPSPLSRHGTGTSRNCCGGISRQYMTWYTEPKEGSANNFYSWPSTVVACLKLLQLSIMDELRIQLKAYNNNWECDLKCLTMKRGPAILHTVFM